MQEPHSMWTDGIVVQFYPMDCQFKAGHRCAAPTGTDAPVHPTTSFGGPSIS
jgi:hypothetical protein